MDNTIKFEITKGKLYKLIGAFVSLFVVVAVTAGCATEDSQASAQTDSYYRIAEEAAKLVPYEPHNDVEFNNFNEAQKLYDSPDTIIWCTAFPNSPTAPIITVPIAGKLTSSSTTFYSPDLIDSSDEGKVVTQARSVDKMYHPDPPQYRYGFTPGGQYVDFFQMPTLCTTKAMKFQTQNIRFEIDTGLEDATNEAQKALEAGNKEKAQKILEKAAK